MAKIFSFGQLTSAQLRLYMDLNVPAGAAGLRAGIERVLALRAAGAAPEPTEDPVLCARCGLRRRETRGRRHPGKLKKLCHACRTGGERARGAVGRPREIEDPVLFQLEVERALRLRLHAAAVVAGLPMRKFARQALERAAADVLGSP